MGAHATAMNLDRALRAGFFNVNDPGASGTISWTGKGRAICKVVTAGSESRALPSATGYGVGSKLRVILNTAGGALSITGADRTVALAVAGETADFVVSQAAGVNVWRVAGVNVAPISLGTVDINTGDAPSDAGIIALFNALKSLGLVSGTWS